MAKVYAFPVKKELPEDLKGRLDKIAKAYVELLSDVYKDVASSAVNEEDMAELTEVMIMAYMEAIEKAIEELGEG